MNNTYLFQIVEIFVKGIGKLIMIDSWMKKVPYKSIDVSVTLI